MNHLDEGTIHGWLDGALDAAQSADIEAHVAACPACAAAVAEARGFIAGASRILSALDDVPGGVLPGRVVRPLRPRWRVAPWATGIAAVLLAAVVLRTGMATRGGVEAAREGQDVLSMTAGRSPDSLVQPLVLSPQMPPPAAQSTASDVALPPTPSAVVATGAAPAPARSQRAASTGGSAGAGAGAGAGVGAAAVAAVAAVERTRDERAESRQGGSDLAANQQRAAAVVEAQVDTATVVAPEQRARSLAAGQAALSEIVVTAAKGTIADTASFEGCYRLVTVAGGVARGAIGAVAGAVSDGARRARAREAPQAAPSAPSAPAARADYSSAPVPAVVRLDTIRAALGLSVADAVTGAPTGWWRTLGDSARVDLGTRGVYMLGRSARVACP